MVGIVIVSHSAQLAESIRDLARQMTPEGEAPLAAAGGVDDPENPFGTDALKVYEAIEAVYSPDGVLVMMDLGSALLSAETALEFLTPEQQANVYLCAAPIVEGVLTAAVQASIGADIHQVLAEAQGALAMKSDQLTPSESEPAASAPAAPPAEAQVLRLTIKNHMGLHARPAAALVRVAGQYQADIWVGKDGRLASARSVTQLVTLGVRQGDEIVITAAGPAAGPALAALQRLVDNSFGEENEPVGPQATGPAPQTQPAVAAAGQLTGIPASPGIAIGPAFHFRPKLPDIEVYEAADPEAEWTQLQQAITAAEQDLQTLQAQAAKQIGASKAAILAVHRLFLQDPSLLDMVKTKIFEDRLNAEAAWQQAVEAMSAEYRSLDDDYLRGRAADVLDVGDRVLRQLLDLEPPALETGQPVILLASELSPSDTARLDPAAVLGVCTSLGGETSHSAILARALGIPAIVSLAGSLETIPEGQTIALDGGTGRLWLQPDAEQLAALEQQRDAWRRQQQQAKATSQQPAVTQDGRRIEIGANIGGPPDITAALEFGAEGVGLFRTEFLFMGRPTLPSEEEQLAAYKQAAQAMGRRPLIIRTLDVGGDKPLPYLEMAAEENPFLGQRGIRFCLARPAIFKSQLRAILQATPDHNIKLMFPMISALSELRAARRLLEETQADLKANDLVFDETIEVGMMIETPAAVAIADQLAAEVDFFSIGSNDLTQYVMAADRGNSQVAGLVNSLQPAVLRFIRQTVQAAQSAGIWVGLCGELAGRPLAAPLLVGLGLDELSISATNIPAVKTAIRDLTLKQAQYIAQTALTLNSAEAVENYLTFKARFGDTAPVTL